MDRYAIERALGIIEGIVWIVTENTITDALTDALINAVGMIDNALKEPCVGEIAKEKKQYAESTTYHVQSASQYVNQE